MIVGLPTEYVGFYWHQLAPLIEKALKRLKMQDMYSLEDVKRILGEKTWQCWVYCPEKEKISCVFITNLIEFPAGRKIFSIILAGGSGLKDWKEDIHEFFIERAKEQGCDEIRFTGRAGWKKVYGFDVIKQYQVKLWAIPS